MRPQLHVVRLGEGRHLRDVAVEHLEIEHQRRRVQRAPRALLADQMAVQSSRLRSFRLVLQGCRVRTTMASPVVPRLTPALFMKMLSPPVPQSATPWASRPPSTLTVSPVMKRASSEHRKAATSAMTLGLAAIGPRLLAELLLVFLRPAAMNQRRGDHAGRDADHADAIRAELGRHILDQADDGGLGRRIGVAAAAAHHAGDRGGDQDHATICHASSSPARRASCRGTPSASRTAKV